jgi:death-on-curing protein
LLFLRKQEVLNIHSKLIEDFGGSHGLREEGALESALAAAENRAFYESADLAVCAATYAYHLTQAHAFIDGNKRVAAAVAEVLLEFNGARFEATNDEIVLRFLSIAAGEVSRDEVEEFFSRRVILDP